MLAKIILGLGVVLGGGALWTGQDSPASAQPTYAGEIAPILNKHCVDCHRPNEVGPFSLLTYTDAAKRAPMIAVATARRIMPPWKVAPGHGEFLGARRLSDQEIELLRNWDAAGAPEGDRAKTPKPPPARGKWSIGKPDLVLAPPKAVAIAAEGADEYRNFVLKTDFKETRYVAAIECQPGNPRIVHHVAVFIDESGQAAMRDAQDTDGQEGYTTFGSPGFQPASIPGVWAPGFSVPVAAKGTAFAVKPGATLVMQVHYHRSGKPETDLTQLGLHFAKEANPKPLQVGLIVDLGLDIPPGDSNYRRTKTYTLPEANTLHRVLPHMHLLGRSMKADAELPDGSKLPLVLINDWDFNWQNDYTYARPIELPKGTIITVEASFDNSFANPRNPSSPPQRTRFGEQTTDEMLVLMFTFTSASNTPLLGIGGQ